MFVSMGSEVFWLNATNVALGVVCLAFVLLAVGAVVQAIVRVARRSSVAHEQDAHTLSVAGLGTTMADGGQTRDKISDEEAWLEWDPEYLSLSDRSRDKK